MAALSSLAFAGTATAHHGSNDPATACGQVVTADLVLTHDVGPCAAAAPSEGALTVRASGTSTDPVTVNLNGKKVFGCTDPLAPCNALTTDPSLPYVTGEGPGIVIDNKDYVQITDSATGGTVSDFDTGIVIRGGRHNVVEKVDVKRNVGTATTNSDYGEGIGIYAYLPSLDPTDEWQGSTNNTIKANTVGASPTEECEKPNVGGCKEGNGPYGGIAVYNFDDTKPGSAAPPGTTHSNIIGGPTAADGNFVKDNYVAPNGTTYQDDGVRIEPGVTKTTVRHNTVTGSSLDGIAVFFGATETQVLDNKVRDNGHHPLTHRKGDGIRVFLRADGATITGNTVTGNGASGIRVDSLNNKINANTATGNNPSGRAGNNDLYDSQADGKCANVSPTPVTPNRWGNLTANTFDNANRDPAATGYADCIA
jgi:parallel beta-helix repeat protein